MQESSLDTDTTLVYPIRGINVDAIRLRSDFENVKRLLWTDQNRNKNKGWKGVALYSASGKTEDLGLQWPVLGKFPRR